MSQEIVQIKYCCEYMKDAVEGIMNAVHITEMNVEKVFAPFYMNVETNEGVKPCFLKYCPECGSKLSDHKWNTMSSVLELSEKIREIEYKKD